MTPEYLKEALPSLLNADFAGATNVRLLWLARAYAALCGLATFDSPAGEFGTRRIWLQRIDTLFGVLRERCRRESDAALRCAAEAEGVQLSLLSDYDLTGEAPSAAGTLVLGYGSLKDEACASVGETLKKVCMAAREASVTV